MKNLTAIISALLLTTGCSTTHQNKLLPEPIIQVVNQFSCRNTKADWIAELHDNGNYRTKARCQKGRINGEVHTYYPNGTLALTRIYADDEFSGEAVVYFGQNLVPVLNDRTQAESEVIKEVSP